MTTKEKAARIRKALKTRSALKRISVKMGTGTARCWIDIAGSAGFERFTAEEANGLREAGLPVTRNAYSIAPESIDYTLQLLAA